MRLERRFGEGLVRVQLKCLTALRNGRATGVVRVSSLQPLAMNLNCRSLCAVTAWRTTLASELKSC